MKMELKLWFFSSRPVLGSFRISYEISLIISVETSWVALVHTSTTLLYFSVRVMIPSRYWRSMSSTSAWEAARMSFLRAGMMRSFTPILTPARVANS